MVDGNDEGEVDDKDDVVSDDRKPEHDPHARAWALALMCPRGC
jgi:hypothetical protein